jgi:hypothetical protein
MMFNTRPPSPIIVTNDLMLPWETKQSLVQSSIKCLIVHEFLCRQKLGIFHLLIFAFYL